jgi:hypothetical protein
MHLHQDTAAVNGHVGRRPLVIAVHAGGLHAAARASGRLVPGPRPQADRAAVILDILNNQSRQPREHSPHKIHRVNHDSIVAEQGIPVTTESATEPLGG